MKYICLGYMKESTFEGWSETERNAFIDECFTYDDQLRKNGHFVGGEALQPTRNATTLRYQNGKVAITDGPYAETKEQLGGIMILEARDLNHAIQLMSKHPSVRHGSTWEIRPSADLSDMLEESAERRGGKSSVS
jgi:hypothetical protein